MISGNLKVNGNLQKPKRETSAPDLYHLIHPSFSGGARHRVEILKRLRSVGYQIGNRVMIGIPGQTYESLAGDIEIFRELDLDMVGVGPYIPHPETPVATGEWRVFIPDEEQVPNTEGMTDKVIALTRMLCPEANIPGTTALATINIEQGRELGFMRGANVVIRHLTPLKYRALYEIYLSKACIRETAWECHSCLTHRIHSIGRGVGIGRGDRIHRINSRGSLLVERKGSAKKGGFKDKGLLI